MLGQGWDTAPRERRDGREIRGERKYEKGADKCINRERERKRNEIGVVVDVCVERERVGLERERHTNTDSPGS